MSHATILFFLSLCIIILLAILLYQQFIFRKGIQKNLKELGDKLEEILDSESSEKIMCFTDNKSLIHFMKQINRLLEQYQKIQVDFHRSELCSKKMLSNISHDIKTPMTVILGYLEIMQLNQNGNNEMLTKVEQKAQNVMELINQFFTLAKLEAGDTNIPLSKINLNECCRENVLDFYEILTQKDFEVEIKIPEYPIFIQGNKDALQRILFNLISNTIRYGFEGNYLGVFVYSDQTYAYIDIVDKGKGIEKPFAKTVFNRLFTMEDSRNREIQGNGLGLTIAKQLANQLGGDILLYSEPSIRTTFTVKFKKILY